MDGTLLRFYVHEHDRLHWKPLWEWLLEEARRLGIAGGSAFRAMAGFGHHGVLHADRFFELQGSMTIEVEFAVTGEQATRLLDRLREEKLRVCYSTVPVHFDVIDTLDEPARSRTASATPPRA